MDGNGTSGIGIQAQSSASEYDALIEDRQPGDLVFFGRHSSSDHNPDAIEWQVLEQDEDTVKLISQRSLAIRRYDGVGGRPISWKNCELRRWLNSEFIYQTFSAEEQMRLVTWDAPSILTEPEKYGYGPGSRTRDRVCLLSLPEAQRYFPTNASRVCDLEEWARGERRRDAYASASMIDGEVVWEVRRGGEDFVWWLWSPPHYHSDVVGWDGEVRLGDHHKTVFTNRRHSDSVSLRPVIRVWRKRPHAAKLETIRLSQADDVVVFGRYPQRGADPEPIEWQVLSNEDGVVRMISRYVLDARPWHDEHGITPWEDSGLRAWLNGEFRDVAFVEAERAALREVDAERHDTVSLMDVSEVRRRFAFHEQRLCYPTPHALQQGRILRRKDGPSWWWLKSTGRNPFCAAGVDDHGYVRSVGRYHRVLGGVRPMIAVVVG